MASGVASASFTTLISPKFRMYFPYPPLQRNKWFFKITHRASQKPLHSPTSFYRPNVRPLSNMQKNVDIPAHSGKMRLVTARMFTDGKPRMGWQTTGELFRNSWREKNGVVGRKKWRRYKLFKLRSMAQSSRYKEWLGMFREYSILCGKLIFTCVLVHGNACTKAVVSFLQMTQNISTNDLRILCSHFIVFIAGNFWEGNWKTEMPLILAIMQKQSQ